MKEMLLIKYGEIVLRGANRRQFERQLLGLIRQRLSGFKNIRVTQENGRFIAQSLDGAMDYERMIPLVTKVFGVIGVSPCVVTEDQSLLSLCETALAYLQRYYADESFTFKVITKRCDKRYPMTSQEISAEIGGYILEHMPQTTVDVHNPQINLYVELRNDAYLYAKTFKAFGGLPYGSSGKGVLLLSGGIDSPVAGFMMAKRGIEITAVYFHSPPYTSERAKDKVLDLAKTLVGFTGSFKLYIIPFTEIQLALLEKTQPQKLTILLKRAMLRIAEKIAEQEGAQCLITGDSVGQVASQTLHSLLAVQEAARLPILRPLAGMDKQEIIDWARTIGTFDISIRPYQDCCTVFVADHPETKPKADAIHKEETRVENLAEMLETAVEKAEVLTNDYWH